MCPQHVFDKHFLEKCLAFLADTCCLALFSELMLMLSGDVESNPGLAHVAPEAPICLDANNRSLMLSGDVKWNPGSSDTLDEKIANLLQNHESVSKTLNDIKSDQRSIQKTANESANDFKDLDARLIKVEVALNGFSEVQTVIDGLLVTVAALTRKIDDLKNRSK